MQTNTEKHLRLGGPRFHEGGSSHFALLCVLCLSALLPFAARAHEDLLGRIVILDEQMRTNGVSLERLLSRADLYRAHQDWASALQDYDEAAKGLTNSSAVDFGRAQALAGYGKWVEARMVFDRLLQRNSTNAPALLGRARVLTQLNQRSLAIADYSRAFTNLANPHPEDYLERARLQVAESGPAVAAEGLDEGLARLGWTLTLQLAAMDYDLARGDHTGALARLETIIVRSSHRESWLALKGEILQKAGRMAEARDIFQAGLKAIDNLPPRLAASERMVTLRAKIKAALISMELGGETNTPASLR